MTKNFKRQEFECKGTCDKCKKQTSMPLEVYENVIKLAGQLQILRDYVGRPVRINSAYRCVQHNDNVGGSKTSQHKLGKAADITIQSLKPTLLSLSKTLQNEWRDIDLKIGKYEDEKKSLLNSFPTEIIDLYDDLKSKGVEVIAAYKRENQ